MKNLNILFVLHEGSAGGASKCIMELAEIYLKKGHHVYVLIPFKKCEVAEKLEKMGATIIPQLYFWWQYPSHAEKWRQLIFKVGYRLDPIFYQICLHKLKKYHFDIIHSNSSVIHMGAKLASALYVKHVWHFREFGEPDHGTRYISGKSKSMNYVNHHTDKIIFVSQAVRDYYGKQLDNSLCRVIYDGIPENYIYQKDDSEYYHNDGKVHFLISGAMQPGKGQDSAIKACAKLRESGYTNFSLSIAGRDISNYGAHLRSMIASYGLSDYVTILGFTNEILNVRKEHDVELVCSSREAFGRVTVEAMMCSNPVIASKSGGSIELVRHGENGFLFEPGNVDELASYMEMFIKNPSLLSSMGHAACSYASEHFTVQKNADSIESLYYSLLNDD